jgi:hypothetical protein
MKIIFCLNFAYFVNIFFFRRDEESYFTVPNVPNSTKVWNSVKRYMHNTNEQCMAEYPNIADDIIAEYWRPLSNKQGVEGKEKMLKTLD